MIQVSSQNERVRRYEKVIQGDPGVQGKMVEYDFWGGLSMVIQEYRESEPMSNLGVCRVCGVCRSAQECTGVHRSPSGCIRVQQCAGV